MLRVDNNTEIEMYDYDYEYDYELSGQAIY